MVTTLITIHGINETYLAAVMATMRTLGAPTVRVVDCGDHYVAVEGTHRIEAAARLGLAPVLDVLEQDTLVQADSLDLDWLQAGESYTAGEIAGEVYTVTSGIYRIERDGTVALVSASPIIPGAAD